MSAPQLTWGHTQEVVGSLDICLQRIIQSLPVVLAGGYIRDVLLGSKPKDVDLFLPLATGGGLVPPEEAGVSVILVRESISELLGPTAATPIAQAGVTTWARIGGPTPGREESVQLIHRRGFQTPAQLIDGFDLTMTQAAMWVDPTGVWKSVCGPCFYVDLKSKTLRLVSGIDRTSMRRLCRFYERGWRPPPDGEGEMMKEYPSWDAEVGGGA